MRCISGDAVTGDAAPEAPNPPGFAVEVPGFTGPFRLLADLILEQKVDVCDVPIATVTDGFLRYAKDTAAWNLEEATWFLAICAVLLELKISRLTPKHAELDEEDLLGASPDLAYARSIDHFLKHGEAGLMEVIRANLAEGAAAVRRYADREHKLRVATR